MKFKKYISKYGKMSKNTKKNFTFEVFLTLNYIYYIELYSLSALFSNLKNPNMHFALTFGRY